MPASPATSVRSLQAQSAAARRWGTANQDDLARDYTAAKLEDYILRTVAAAPELTAEQRNRLASIFAGGAHAAAS